MKPINFVHFGDQAVEKLSSIQALVRHAKTSSGARRFLEEATDLVQSHFSELSKEARAWNHDVHTLLGLAEDNVTEDEPNPVIATVLMCIGRLGELIVWAEEDPSILGSENDRVQVLAFCTGLLPAAALVAAKDSSELFELGREIISITFRMSVAMQQRLSMIEDLSQSWAITLVGKTPADVQPILDDFHQRKDIPFLKRIAIAVVATGWLTLTGAPSSLRCLMEFSDVLDEAPRIKTDTKAAHTPYVPSLDIDAILGNSQLLDTPITSKARILSPSSCKPYAQETLRSLISNMIQDIIYRPLFVEDTIDACISGFKDKCPVALTIMGPSTHLQALERTLKSRSVKYQTKQHRSSGSHSSIRGGSGLVAIVGMSAKLPGSDTVDAFFESLMEGKIQLKKIPETRFDVSQHYDPTGRQKNSTSTNQGAFLENPGYFDNRLFNISPREALQMDPLQRMLLTTSWEALEMAGYSKDATPSTQSNRIATYFGQAADDWRDVINNEGIDIYYVPALSRPFGTGRLAYHHKWGGGTYTLDSACSTSTTAIHLACQALSSRECDTALAGGGSLCISPMTFAGLSKSGMISDNGGCRTYHDDADGYARGEGVGVVVLKRLEDAITDNDNILGVISGHARTYTTTSTSITHPSAAAQARVYREVLRQTATAPSEIAYVEMHGTGTQSGDFEEMSSVIQVFGSQRSKMNVLTVGAVKANVGHGEAAAGVTSLIKVLMMMREKRIPPQPGFPFKINRNFPNLDALNIRIAGIGGKDQTLRPSPTSANSKIKCLVSSFDATGGNTSLIIEEAPTGLQKIENPLGSHVVVLSAKTPASLQGNQKRLLDFLTRNPDTKLADLAYTTTARRMHEVLRVAYTGTSTKSIINSLREDVARNAKKSTKPPPTTVVFAFTGQGSQYAGMGKELYRTSFAFQELLQTYQQLAEHMGLPHFLHLISDQNIDMETSSTVVAQLAIVALEIATAHLLKSWGIKPCLVIGHSLGEYSALCVAGVLSVSDTLYLVGRRAQLMEEKLVRGQYAMIAVHKDVKATQHLLATESRALSNTRIACINAPEITVVSGPVNEISQLQKVLETEESKFSVLRTLYGFHSEHVQPILEDFEQTASAVSFSAPATPIASTLLGRVIEAGERDVFSPQYLIRQTRECVDFIGALRAYQVHHLARSQTMWIEIGPEPMCVGLARRVFGNSSNQFLHTMKSTEDNWVSISNILAALYQAGVALDWPQYHKPFMSSLNLLTLPTYAFDEKDYWIRYTERIDPRRSLSQDSREDSDRGSNIATVPPFSTTSLQRVEEESVEAKTVSVTFASHTSEPNLYEAIQGHVVNGTALMSMSIFCDMGKSAAKYAYQKICGFQKLPNMSIYDLDLTHALVVQEPDPEQIVRTKVSFSEGTDALVSFTSTKRSVVTDHGSLRVRFEDSSGWFAQQNQTAFLVDARVQSLKEMSAKGQAHRLMKTIIYRLFSNLVSYGPSYRAIEEAWIDTDCRDAVGTIKLSKAKVAENFLYDPFWSDGAVHLGGFLLNGGLKYNEETTFLCTGLESWKLLEELRAGEEYTTYTAIQETGTPNILSGSAYLFDTNNKLVQVATGIRFQKMKRITLSAILGASPVSKSLAANLGEWGIQPSEDSMSRGGTGILTPDPSRVGDFDQYYQGFNGDIAITGCSTPPDALQLLLSIIIAESGCGEEELESGALFSDVGVDSLMAITIIANFRKKLGIELPVTFFLDYPTVTEAKEALLGSKPACESPQLPVAHQIDSGAVLPTIAVSEAAMSDFELNQEQGLQIDRPRSTASTRPSTPLPNEGSTGIVPPSKVILLHGSPSFVGTKLFLFPDGSGSPSCYIQLPPINPALNVHALQSPFLKNPAEFTCSMEAICESFLHAIQKVQPKGPYLLGGFSFGALYAYEVTRMLGERGEVVDGLFIIDMAVPNTTITPPAITKENLAEAGLLPSTGVVTPIQKEHFTSTVRAMVSYNPFSRISPVQPKKTFLMFSKDGLAADKQSDLALWAQGNVSESRGWDNVISGTIERRELTGSHFGLFRYPAVKSLGAVWVEAFASL